MPSGEDDIRPEPGGLPADMLALVGGDAALLERLPLVTYIADLDDGNLVRWVSSQSMSLTGFEGHEYVDRPTLFLERVHPDDRDRVLASLRARTRSADVSVGEFRMVHRDGRVIWVMDRRVAIAGNGRRLVVGALADVTDRKLTEEALAHSEAVSDSVLESLGEGLIVVNAAGEVVRTNRKAVDMLGASVAELETGTLDRPVTRVTHSDGSPGTPRLDAARRVLAEGVEIRDVELRVERPDGEERWLRVNFTPLKGVGSDSPQGVVCSLSDVTESRRVATELEESERRFREVADNVDAVFWMRDDRTGEVLYVSDAYEQIWGRPLEQVLNNPEAWLDAIHPDDRRRVAKLAVESKESGTYDAEYRIIRPDGAERWIHDRAFSLRATSVRRDIVSGMAEDVTDRRRTEAELRVTRDRARAAFLNAPIGAALFSLGTVQPVPLIEVNPALCAMLGYPEAVLLQKGFAELVHPNDGPSDLSRWERLVQGELDRYVVERCLLRSDGRPLWARLSMSLVRDAEGEPAYGVAQIEDITSTRRAARQQDAVARLGQQALEGTGIDELIVSAVTAVTEILSTPIAGVLEHLVDEQALVGRFTVGLPADAPPPERRRVVEPGYLGKALAERRPIAIEDWATETEHEHSEFTRKHSEGGALAVPIEGPAGAWGVLTLHTREPRRWAPDEISFAHAIANVLGAAIQRWTAEEETRRRALHDPLTGLPNRTLLIDRLAHALERSRRSGTTTALLFMDLDHFKVINDSLGHEAGDGLLQSFAPRLQETLRPSDTVARFGGDEFVVLCEDLHGEQDAAQLAERILESLATPFQIGSQELFTSATIGLALARPGDAPEGLIRDADAAMYRAKARGRGRYEVFDQEMRERVNERLGIENALRRALADGALSLHLQPIVSLDDRSIVGAEALLRWHDAERGWIPPAQFIPIAEESGLIVPIGDWVIEEATRLAVRWPTPPDGSAPTIAVNISARQVAQPGFAERLGATLERSGLAPERLALEITESVLMEEAEAPMEAVRDLERLGVKLVLDDFGTGYSSLSYLNRLPIDVLKLDRSFIEPLRSGAITTAAIVSGVVTMAEALGMTVVAEGVEAPAQVAELRALGCGFAQGFLFARPMPPAELEALLLAGSVPDSSIRNGVT
jgi:diguanylate cyclase (GGDEF)-like protein/PAS domain S-box-containing protein